MHPPAPVVVTELEVPDDADALRLMAVFYGESIRAGFGATYFGAIRDLLDEIGTVSRPGRCA